MNEDIKQFNEKCARFLGWLKIEELGDNQYKMGKTVYKLDDVSDPEKWLIDLVCDPKNSGHFKFYSEWNWIMPVVEAIEAKQFRFEIANNRVDLECMRIDLDRFSGHINQHDCVGYGSDLHLTKKQAVVKAIDRFLHWWYLTQEEE